MTDFATERRNMVDGQVRTADVTDLRIISAMLDVPRERFVPPQAAAIAYLDLDLPVGESGRRLLKRWCWPSSLQAADIAPTDRVLDVGCATGYGAAVLGRVAGDVIALEQDESLLRVARNGLAPLPNVSVVSGPLDQGWPPAAPYDVILLEGATETVPDALCRQLKHGGRLVCVLGAGRAPGHALSL